MNQVSHFLQRQGHTPQRCRFLDTDFMLGERIDCADFSLTYRQEDTRLVICDFSARQDNGRALQSLMTLVQQIIAAVPTLRSIDALILDAPQAPALQQTRQRLTHWMLARGAKPVRIDGELWLRYPCRPAPSAPGQPGATAR